VAAEWRNWAGNVTARPVRIERPSSIPAVQNAVRRAVANGLHVRVAGAGHSFSPICETDGVLLDLVDLTGVVSVDEARATATVLGGTRIHQMGVPLFEHGLAVANQGDIDVQAIAGALGTGTHGTGRAFGSFSSTLVAAQLVTANGNLITVDESDLDILRAARVALGMLGVMVTATLKLVPAYKLRRRSWPVDMDCLAEHWQVADRERRNPEFWWIPPLDRSVFKTFVETGDEPTGTPPASATYPPGTIERYLPPDGVDWAWRVFPAVREHRFVEMEYAVPLERGMDAFLAIRDLMRTSHPEVRWAVEYRTHAAEDGFLSVTQGAETVTISVHDAAETAHFEFFREAERVFRSFGGRPHWGKLNLLDPDELRAAFPGINQFEEIRRRLDPDGLFLNAWLAERFTELA
jgi:FAD/FMN-containing dehydrogenase